MSQQQEETIEIIGPVYKDAEGFAKVNYEPRKIPKRLWENPEHRKDLIQAGMRRAEDINEPALSERRGRKSNAEKEVEKLRAELAAMKAAKTETKETDTDAGKA